MRRALLPPQQQRAAAAAQQQSPCSSEVRSSRRRDLRKIEEERLLLVCSGFVVGWRAGGSRTSPAGRPCVCWQQSSLLADADADDAASLVAGCRVARDRWSEKGLTEQAEFSETARAPPSGRLALHQQRRHTADAIPCTAHVIASGSSSGCALPDIPTFPATGGPPCCAARVLLLLRWRSSQCPRALKQNELREQPSG